MFRSLPGSFRVQICEFATVQKRGGMDNCLTWFRSDLRLSDNSAFTEASRHYLSAVGRNPAVRLFALFVVAPWEWRHGQLWGLAKCDYYWRTAQILEKNLAALGVPLLVYRDLRQDYANADEYCAALAEGLERLCRENGIGTVFWNEEYDAWSAQRDACLRRAFDSHGIAHLSFDDQCAVQPAHVTTQSGTPYKVFSHFKKSWASRIEQRGLSLTESLSLGIPSVSGKPDLIEDMPPGFVSDECPELDLVQMRETFPAGEQAAMERLSRFLSGPVNTYHEDRSHYVDSGSSRMSASLAVGAISIRQCLLEARRHNQGRLLTGDPGLTHWIGELCWRDFYRYVLVHFPHVVQGRAFRAEYEDLPWRAWPVDEKTFKSEDATAEADFERWINGTTGVPIVDAGMRQLRREGWQNNRLRMIVAMYLTKDLRIHWKRGERYFMQHLVDYDFASNNGGWQWSASTGTDAQPYFRIFNPLLQSEKFDPSGAYIKKYVAELAKVSAPAIHQPDKRMGREEFKRLQYPSQMVDHQTAKDKVLAMFTQRSATKKRPAQDSE